MSLASDLKNGVTADASEASYGGFSRMGSTGSFGNAQTAGGGNPFSNDPYGMQMQNCEIRASVPGFRSDIVSLTGRNSMDNPDLGLIVLHRLANVEGTSVSATALMAPKDARKAYEKGMQVLQKKGKSEDAVKEFERAVLAYPKYADAWVSIGKLRLEQGNVDAGRDAMLKAMESDSKLVIPYIELGMIAAVKGQWQDATHYLDRGLRLDPVDFPKAWYADAAANFNLKKYDVAERAVIEARKLDLKHDNPRIEYLMGLILAEKKDYTGAAEQFRNYLRYSPGAPDADKVKEQLSQIDKYLAGVKSASNQ